MSKRSDDQRKAMFANLNKGSVGKKKSKRLKKVKKIKPKLVFSGSYSLPQGVKRLDPRSKKAIAIDKGKIAKHRFNPGC